MVARHLGRSGLSVSPVAFGAFKIGRNTGIKYPDEYELPDERSASALLEGVLDLGIDLIDTAPAYGASEERIGRAIAHRRDEFAISTKVGERYEQGRSIYDFSSGAMRRSVRESLDRLRTDAVEILLLHPGADDLDILERTDAVETLVELRDAGFARAIGLSARTLAGARSALAWADVLMVEYRHDNRALEPAIAEAAAAGVGILVKKALASGRLAPGEAIGWALANRGVGSVVLGSTSLEHMRANVRAAEAAEATGSSVTGPATARTDPPRTLTSEP